MAQCPTAPAHMNRLLSSVRGRDQAVVAAYGASTHCWAALFCCFQKNKNLIKKKTN